MECPICFEIITNSCYGSCSHHYCYKCLMRWCNNGGTKCPICRERMFQIILDKEFDLKNNPLNKEKIKKRITKEIVIKFNNKKALGISLSKIDNDKNIGIIVSKLEKNNKLSEYLKVNDKILYLNDLPCINVKDTIEIIKYTYNNGLSLKIELSFEKNKKNKEIKEIKSKIILSKSFLYRLMGCFNVVNIN